MSELKVYVPQDGPYGLMPEEGGQLVEEETCYLKSEVDKVIAEKDEENRRLKRALYKACANWALSTLAWLDCIDQGEPRKWSEMVQKCRKKAEEYR